MIKEPIYYHFCFSNVSKSSESRVNCIRYKREMWKGKHSIKLGFWKVGSFSNWSLDIFVSQLATRGKKVVWKQFGRRKFIKYQGQKILYDQPFLKQEELMERSLSSRCHNSAFGEWRRWQEVSQCSCMSFLQDMRLFTWISSSKFWMHFMTPLSAFRGCS